jgi:hypothetical protein
MEWEFIAPVIISTVMFLTVGGVMVLRPIAKRVGDLIELYVRDRQESLHGEALHMRDLLETMNALLQLLEDRQDFTERLLTGQKSSDPVDEERS